MGIAIATISMARNEAEAAELSGALRELKKSGWPVFVADRASVFEFRKFLDEEGFSVLEGAKGLVDQARSAVKGASEGGGSVLYTEPDKRFFFSDRLQEFLREAASRGAELNEVILPGRSAASYRTFSAFQQRVERAVNEFCSRLFGVEGDFLYGPILFPASLADCLDKFPAEFGWGWRLYLLRAARRRGMRIVLREMDLPCPENQRADTPEEWLHRMRQHSQNLAALLFEGGAEEFSALRGLAPSWTVD